MLFLHTHDYSCFLFQILPLFFMFIVGDIIHYCLHHLSTLKSALIKLDPILPAPPITRTFIPFISRVNTSAFASILPLNILSGLDVTESLINLSRLDLLFYFFYSISLSFLFLSLLKISAILVLCKLSQENRSLVLLSLSLYLWK